jgi:hypothetical protein
MLEDAICRCRLVDGAVLFLLSALESIFHESAVLAFWLVRDVQLKS